MTGGQRPKIDVVVLTWNDGPQAERAVASAVSSRDVDVTVTVVDNASDIPFHSTKAQVLRPDHNLGVGGGRNLGASVGCAPVVCFLDSDAALAPDCLSNLVRSLEAGVGIAVPVFLGQHATVGAGRAPTLGRKLRRGLGLTDRYAPLGRPWSAPWWEVDFGIGACQCVRRETMEAVGGLDASATFGPEDVDFCLRAKAAGWRVVQVGAAVCAHQARRSHRRLLSPRGIRHALAVVRYLRRWRPGTPRARVAANGGWR